MHVPSQFIETNATTLHDLIKAHPLGTWITSYKDNIEVNHIPFVLEVDSNGLATLKGHINRTNPLLKSLNALSNSVVVFQGAESYISPSWYASKPIDQKVVPTWNYAVVHAHGKAQLHSEKEWLLSHLNSLTDSQENRRTQPWRVSDAPDDYIARMLRGIVGIEIPIEKLEGTWKTSQNKSNDDKLGVIRGLDLDHDRDSNEMSSYVREHANDN